MLNKNAKKWVAALRSGAYRQTQGELNDEKGFCCLGVACDLYEKETGEKLRRADFDGTKSCFYFGTDLDSHEQVRAWLGLQEGNGGFNEVIDGTCSLVGLNDNLGFTFEQLADVIESEPKGLFYKGSADESEC